MLNLGRYEHQAYLNVAGRLTGKKKEQALARKEQEFPELILKACRAEPLGGGSFGKVGRTSSRAGSSGASLHPSDDALTLSVELTDFSAYR